MSAEDRQRISARWGMQIAAVMAVIALAAELFRMNDPWLLLPLSLCVAVSVLRLHFRFSAVDAAVLAVCLYDVATWILNPITRMYAARISLTGLCVYLLLREASCRTEGIPLFLKLATGITSVALAITLASFAIWTEAVHGAGFADVYPFRFLFRPFGYITNAWASVWLPVLGMLTVGMYRITRWRKVFGVCWVLASITMLLSFSRGAFVSWAVYVTVLCVSMATWRYRLVLVAVCVFIVGTVWMLFPTETGTTLAMKRTESQRQSTESRFRATEQAMTVIKEHLWTGTGNGSYTLAMDRVLNEDSTRPYTSYAPNVVVQVLVEKGLTGMMLYIGLCAAVVIYWIKYRKKKTMTAIAACLLAVGVKEMTMSIMLADGSVWILTLILLALMQTEAESGNETVKSVRLTAWMRYMPLAVGCCCWIAFMVLDTRLRMDNKAVEQACEAWKKGNHKEALQALEQTSDRFPCRINKAIVAAFAPDSTLSEGYRAKIRQQLELDMNDTDVYADFLRGRLYRLDGKYEEAMLVQQKLESEFPRNASIAYEGAVLLYEIGRKDEAAEQLRRAIWLRPDWLRTEKTQEWLTTDPDLRRAVEQGLTVGLAKNEGTAHAYARYGALAYYLNRKKEATEILEQVVNAQPGYAVPWLLLGQIYREEGKMEQADSCFRKYNLRIKGAFNNSDRAMENEKRNFGEHQLMLVDYAAKFQNWYRCKLMF